MAKARSKRGAAMVMVIIATVLFTMMSFSLITASSTLSSSANRKWIQLQMEQQAIGVGRALSEALTISSDVDLLEAMNRFLDDGAQYTLLEAKNIPDGYGKVIIRLRKIDQNPDVSLDKEFFIQTSDTVALKVDLDDYLDSVTNVDYQLTANITVVSPEDEQALGTAEVTYFRVKQYEAQYYRTLRVLANRIYPDSNWNFFTTSDPTAMNSSTLVTFTVNEEIVTFTPSDNKVIFYTVAEVWR